MKKTVRFICIMLAAVLCFASAATAEPVLEEHALDAYSASLDQVTGNLIVTLRNKGDQLFSRDGSTPLSEVYGSLYVYSSNFGYIHVRQNNHEGYLDGNGSVLVPAIYPDADIISRHWAVGIKLRESTADNYDYHDSNVAYYLVDRVYIYYDGVLKGSLDRMDYQSAEAFGDYLRIQDREKNYWFYNKELEKQPRLEIVVRAKEEQTARSEYYDDYHSQSVWHQGSGQAAFTEGCTLTPEEVDISLYNRNGDVVDLQGNVVVHPVDCEPWTLRDTHGSLIKVRNQERKYGLIDRSGKMVIPCVYDQMNDTADAIETLGYAYVVRDGKAGYVSVATGAETGFEYSENLCKQRAGYFTITDLDGLTILYSAAAGKLGKFAEVTTPSNYYGATNPLAIVKDEQGRLGVLDMQGEWVIPPDAGFEGRDSLDASFDGTVILAYKSIEREYIVYNVTYKESGIKIDVPSFEDVFVPAQSTPDALPAPVVETVPQEEGWTCENGHAGNTGNFCAECGIPKPTPAPEPAPADEGAWTCENGHGGNTGKFCTECGAPKPAAEEGPWTCPNGHGGNTGNFCAECGAPKP